MQTGLVMIQDQEWGLKFSRILVENTNSRWMHLRYSTARVFLSGTGRISVAPVPQKDWIHRTQRSSRAQMDIQPRRCSGKALLMEAAPIRVALWSGSLRRDNKSSSESLIRASNWQHWWNSAGRRRPNDSQWRRCWAGHCIRVPCLTCVEEESLELALPLVAVFENTPSYAEPPMRDEFIEAQPGMHTAHKQLVLLRYRILICHTTDLGTSSMSHP